MKVREAIMSVLLVLCNYSFLLHAYEKKDQSIFNITDDFSDETLFEGADNFQEPEISDIVIEDTQRRPEISIKDVPFYLKLFCSYVYEEKLQRWYYEFFGYFAHWKFKKINFGK